MKVSELSGAQLNFWVAKATGQNNVFIGDAACLVAMDKPCESGNSNMLIMSEQFSPSTNWQQGGPLIEEHKIGFCFSENGYWLADSSNDGDNPCRGSTPLIASLRCIVRNKYGDEVIDE